MKKDELMKQKVGELAQNHDFDVRKKTRSKCDATKKPRAALELFHPDGWKPISLGASRFLHVAELK